MIKRILLSAALLLAVLSAKSQAIDVRTNDLSLILTVNKNGEVIFQHFGGAIDDIGAFEARKSYLRGDHGTAPSPYSAFGGRNFRYPALRCTQEGGDLNTELRYDSHGKSEISDNVTRTEVVLKDKKTGLTVKLIYTAFQQENVITACSEIINDTKSAVTLHEFYSSMLPVKAGKYLLTHFHGSWAREMQVEHQLLTHGIKSIETLKGVRTTHTENPSFMLSLDTETFDENYGEVIAGALAWSGNFKLNFELDEFNMLNITGGINPMASEYSLRKGESFRTPEMIYTYSFDGAGGASRNLHDWARNYGIHNGSKMCPTLLNSWEGAYFTFDSKTITDMIDDAADMGLEMFVLDDGWFGNKYPRNNAEQGLGDWQINKSKLPEGIAYFVDYAHAKGLKFGLWIEPEMVNPKSELAEKHPDWVVQSPGREKPTVRNQWLLDLSNPKVQDFVFGIFDNVMSEAPGIDYIKWDANRHFESIGSEYLGDKEQSHFAIAYVNGFYRVLKRIREKYPKVLVQACASGGGRVEYGALKHFDEVWTSDNTESLTRAFIQYGTNMIYPAVVTGSHVSAVPNHQTGNVTPIKFRFDIASSGRLGMELQPKDMPENDREFARKAIASYKTYRDLIESGDLYRIASPYDSEGMYSLMYVSKDKRRAVVFAYNLKYQSRTLTPRFRLRGLDSQKKYRLTELNVGKPKFWADGKTLSGAFLSESGINPPLSKVYDSAIYYLEAE